MDLRNLLQRELSEGISEEQLASAIGVSPGAIVEILGGENPRIKVIWEKFARYFRMDVDFLRTGESAYRASHAAAGPIQHVPLVSWRHLEEAASAGDTAAPMPADAVVEATDVSGVRTFALKVQDDSMEPSFRKGEMIFVNPDVPWKPGDFLVVTHRNGGTASTVLRQIRGTDDQRTLHPRNGAYADLPLATDAVVWGKVVRVRKNL